jgi:hypothetical protein
MEPPKQPGVRSVAAAAAAAACAGAVLGGGVVGVIVLPGPEREVRRPAASATFDVVFRRASGGLGGATADGAPAPTPFSSSVAAPAFSAAFVTPTLYGSMRGRGRGRGHRLGRGSAVRNPAARAASTTRSRPNDKSPPPGPDAVAAAPAQAAAAAAARVPTVD